tara:strand:- start:34 stop:339 length:306 start_codon:yes stop_codon:yes gene_type:complete
VLKDIRRNKEERAETISREKKSPVFMDGFKEEAVVVKQKVGFLVNLVKMIKKEQNLAEDRMLLKELNKDVGQLVPPVKLTKGEREHNVATNPKERYVLLRL